MSKHLLFFSHAYLPENTSAVQRSAPLARYLADQGWTVHVVAASHAGFCEDESVWNVPGPRATAAPRRTAFWRMAQRVLPYNDRLPWIPHALLAAERIAARVPLRAVLSTSPPVAAHVAAWLFVRRHRLRWVADLQDPIRGNPGRKRGWARPYDLAIERAVFGRAARVVAVTDAVAEQWRRSWPKLAEKFRTIWMGFDPAEGIGPMPVPVRERRVMLHIGFLYEERHPIALLESLERLCARGELDPSRFLLRLGGRADLPEKVLQHPAGRALAARGCLELDDRHVARDAALTATATADWLLLLDVRNLFDQSYTVPGKLYDYVLTGRPILAVTDPGSPTQQILARSGVGHACLFHGDSAAERDGKLAEFLARPAITCAPSAWFTAEFDARKLAAQMSALLDGEEAGA
ncbi:MAG TPA: glycosyltransferase [Planctomycetota bacterium]|nr:glycosyltransferase [Planctomycetota bacterium]